MLITFLQLHAGKQVSRFEQIVFGSGNNVNQYHYIRNIIFYGNAKITEYIILFEIFLDFTGAAEAGGPGGTCPPTFWHRKKKKGEGGERRGKRVFIQSPTEMYTCIKKNKPIKLYYKMYKTPELPGAPPLDPIRYLRKGPHNWYSHYLIYCPPPPLAYWWVGGGARPPK